MADERANSNGHEIQRRRTLFSDKVNEINNLIAIADHKKGHTLERINSLISELEAQERELITFIVTNPQENTNESAINNATQAVKIRTKVAKLTYDIKFWKQHGFVEQKEDSQNSDLIQTQEIDTLGPSSSETQPLLLNNIPQSNENNLTNYPQPDALSRQLEALQSQISELRAALSQNNANQESQGLQQLENRMQRMVDAQGDHVSHQELANILTDLKNVLFSQEKVSSHGEMLVPFNQKTAHEDKKVIYEDNGTEDPYTFNKPYNFIRDTDGQSPSQLNLWQQLTRFFAYAPWRQNLLMGRPPYASSMFTTKKGRLQKINYHLKNYFQGTQFVDYIWQPALLATLSYDLSCYWRFMNERYGNTLKGIFLGLADNPDTLSTHWGSDRPPDSNYWYAPSTLLGLTFLGGFYHFLRSYRGYQNVVKEGGDLQRNFNLQSVSGQYPGISSVSQKDNENQSSLQVEQEYITYINKSDIDQIVFRILSLSNATSEEMQSDFNRIVMIALTMPDVSLRKYAIDKLAEIGDSFNAGDRNKLNQINGIGLKLLITGAKLRGSANRNLIDLRDNRHKEQAQSKLFSNWFLRQYSYYRLWSIGVDTHPGRQVLFTAFIAWQYFAFYRYWELMYIKLHDSVDYLLERAHCHDLNKEFVYSAQRDIDFCGICPDWSFVPYLQTNDAQACLNALTRQNFTPQELASYITRFKQHSNFSHIDLTAHEWGDWTDFELDLLLGEFEQVISQDLNELDLSRRTPRRSYPIDNKIRRWAEFVWDTGPQYFKMSNQSYGSRRLIDFFPSLINNRTRHVDLTEIDLVDEGMQVLANQLTHPASKIETIQVGNNDITDSGLIAFSNILNPNISLRQVDMRGNNFFDRGITTFVQSWNNSQLHTIVFNDIFLSRNASATLFQGLSQHHLKRISLRNCQLDDASMLAFPGSLVDVGELDISENAITDFGIVTILPAIKDSNLRTFRAAHTQISRDSLELLGAILPETNITTLDLTGCRLQGRLDDFFKGVFQSSIDTLHLSSTNLGTSGMDSFIEAFENDSDNNLTTIYLDDNNLPSDIGVQFIDAIANSSVETVSLSGNQFDDIVVQRIGDYLPTWRLRSINLKNNNLHSVEAIALNLNVSSLEEIDVSSNFITDSGIHSLIQNSMDPIINFDQLQEQKISSGLKRELHQKGPSSSLELLDVSDNLLDTSGAIQLCRVAGVSGYQAQIAGNPIDTTQIDIENCHVSAASRNSPILATLLYPFAKLGVEIVSFFIEAYEENPIATISLMLTIGLWLKYSFSGDSQSVNTDHPPLSSPRAANHQNLSTSRFSLYHHVPARLESRHFETEEKQQTYQLS